MLVLDTSAALEALLADGTAATELRLRLAADGEPVAPHLIDTEVLHALRRMQRTGAIGDARVADAREGLAKLALVRCPHEPLNDRVWQLRHNLTAYDATFVALAEELSVPLVTCDARLASAPGHGAAIELFAPALP